MASDDTFLPHLFVSGTASAQPYTYPKKVVSDGVDRPPRDRLAHSAQLLAGLVQARRDIEGRRRAAGATELLGMALEFESEPGFELAISSLDRRADGIELASVRQLGDVTLATVFVAEGKLAKLESIVRAYRDEDDKYQLPKNRVLVESVSAVRQAAMESFWTDDASLFPAPRAPIWWEVWLRTGDDRDVLVDRFVEHATRVGMRLKDGVIRFPDRSVKLAFGMPEQLSASIEVLDALAELRRAKETPEFFLGLPARERAAWVRDLVGRTEFAGEGAPAVCILDTGVNHAHPLLAPSLAPGDVLTCDPSWGALDHHGHGTEMAGLALYGDLTEAFAFDGPVAVEHRLESVKLVPPASQAPTEPELYGSRTMEAMGRIEITRPTRPRVFCSTITAPDFRDRGTPSSWSATLDSLAAGVDDDRPRLIVQSGGNVDRDDWHGYPDRNDIDHIHDPGQAWNVLTVGAFTDKVVFDAREFPGWTPLAPRGGLSPASTTSVTWASPWPSKPDIVLEGGNALREAGTTAVDAPNSLSLLTTHRNATHRLLTATGDTSAAAAQAGRMAATLMARYPDLWPEAVRALLVHTADWTPAMVAARTLRSLSSAEVGQLLRRYGYGVPNLGRACWSASNVLTLVAQDTLQPLYKRMGESQVKSKDMNLHALPWPRAELAALLDTEVTLRVTLSYFIEPNPPRRGQARKFRYQSYGLRLAMRTPTESLDDFRARVSKDAQDEEHQGNTPQDAGWLIGPKQRNRGSIHSDRWTGTAAQLAERGFLAVYPVGGWWKERAHLGRWGRPVRYALIVTIETPATEVDIYTPVATLVQAAIAVPVTT